MAQFSQPKNLQSGDQVAAGALASIPPLEQQASEATAKQGQVGMAQAGDIQQTYGQLEQMDQQAPQRNTKIMDVAPLFIGLAAIGGRMTGIHAKTMLAATNGMVQGMLQGNEKAFADQQAQFEQSRKRLMEMSQLRQQYYETLYRAYGDTANSKERAIKAARDLVNDGFKHDIDVIKAEAQNKALEDKLFMGLQNLEIKEMQTQISSMREKSLDEHYQREDATRAQGKANKAKERDTEIDNVTVLLDRVIKAEEENPGFAGARGYYARAKELATTTFGADASGAGQFKSDTEELTTRLPKALQMGGSKIGAKWSQEKTDSIMSGVKLGTNAKINIRELKSLRDDLQREKGQPIGEEGGGIPQQLQTKAEGIREQVRSGKMTKEQGVAALMALGGNQ
jgi:hypothetical protein